MSDSCIFVRRNGESWSYVELYVDELLIVAGSIRKINDVAASTFTSFYDEDNRMCPIHSNN